FILTGRNGYDFIRMNLLCALPSIVTVENLIRQHHIQLNECYFRFDQLRQHMNTLKTNFMWGSEDCTGVVFHINYNSIRNTFIGFVTPLTDEEKAPLINIHMAKPLTPILSKSTSFILSSYSTNNKVKSNDILRRWLYIYHECVKRNIRIIGFSTDYDAKYLKSMRVISGFFGHLPNFDLLTTPD
ncbi:unnamed protein product, partial [Didymodactylos carnosus]